MEPETEARLSKLETDFEKLRKKPKDSWDKLAAVAPFVSGVTISVIGLYATSTYDASQLAMQASQQDREIAVARVQTIEKFFPHLSSTDDNVREAALEAIAAMGEEQLALRFAAHFGGRSGAAVLARLANSPDSKVSVQASSALAAQFERLKSVVAIVGSGSIVGLGIQNPKETRGRIATNIASSPGFAGAPVVDTSGRLIGMAESRDGAGNSMVIQAATIREFLVRHNAVR